MNDDRDLVARLRWPGISGPDDNPVSVKLRVEAADEIERLRGVAAEVPDLGPVNRAFHSALRKYPDSSAALHHFWNEAFAGQPQPSAAGLRCPACGGELERGKQRYCPSCGTFDPPQGAKE